MNAPMPAMAAADVHYRYDESPPLGVKLLILTKGGVAIVSDWKHNAGFIAWSPLPKRDKQKERQLSA